jgi:glucose-6-phosphate isomerase
MSYTTRINVMKRIRCDESPIWNEIVALAKTTKKQFDIRSAFCNDASRFTELSQEAPHMFVDLSKHVVDARIEVALLQLAQSCNLFTQISDMVRGVRINTTEDRMVGHVWLRAPHPDCFTDITGTATDEGQTAMASVLPSRRVMLDFAKTIRADVTITDVVTIGIGGSDLGPKMVLRALESFADTSKRFHFVSNIDGDDLFRVLKTVTSSTTLFIVASKSFSTLEPLLNAEIAKQWFIEQGGVNVARHFCAVTANTTLAREFGIENTFAFSDWVGGRYSVWSAIGLAVAIAIGEQKFEQFLAGAHDMDNHFLRAPHNRNLPVRMGLLDFWYRLLGAQSRCITPYHSAFHYFTSYLQQLEMESNGKSVDIHGVALDFDTAPVLWGDVGTNAQHAYFQMLHQGSSFIPTEFIVMKEEGSVANNYRRTLLANALGQAQALLEGRENSNGHQNFSGNRPSGFIVLDALTPATLGSIIALYEHRVFVSGAIWGINSFDQWGVQLGKELAQEIEQRMQSRVFDNLDASTQGLLEYCLNI